MLKLAVLNLWRHKLRTLLSVLGIMIGVASLIALVSIVDGIRIDVENALSKAQGARVVPLNASDPVFAYLDYDWADKIEKIQGVKVALPNIIQVAKTVEGEPIPYGNGTRVLGIDVERLSKATGSGFDGELLEGRDFKASDSGKFVAMVGLKVKKDFDKFLGSKIDVNGKQLKIVGVYTTGSDILDNSILVPIDVARDVTGFPDEKASYLNVQLVNPAEDKKIVERINLIYGDKIKASSLSDFSSQFGEIFSGITLLVALIASIASIVAAVGIINTMLMSVLERFREIGALKSVGWTNGNIAKLILFESFFVGVFGGFCGVLLGFASASAISSFGLSPFITLELVLGSFAGAVFVGIIGGLYPAFVASRMDPVEALRAE